MSTRLTKDLSCYPREVLEKESIVKDCDDEIAKRTFDPCAIAKMQEIVDAVNNLEVGSQGGGIKCQEHVLDLTANTWATVPHTFQSQVCDVKSYDSLGNELDIVSRKNGILLELCSTADISNVLVVVEGSEQLADKKYLSNIDLNQTSVIKNGGFEKIAGDPASPVEGQEWCDTTTNERKVFKNGQVFVYASKSYVDTELEKIERYQGAYDASSGSLPTVSNKTQGDLTQLNAGDTWTVSVAGTIAGIQGDDKLAVGDELKYLGGVVTDANSWLGIQRNIDDAVAGMNKSDRKTVDLVAATGLVVSSSIVSDIHSVQVYDGTGALIEVCVDKNANLNERIITSNASLTGVVVELTGLA